MKLDRNMETNKGMRTAASVDESTEFDALEEEAEVEVQLSYQRLETVLVIEDHEDLNHALALRLEHAGLNVARALDGMSGLRKYELLEPDVIVLDLHLPRMHGFKLLHTIRQMPSLEATPIIVVTGDPDPSIHERVRKWGVRSVLLKPVDPKDVVTEVLEALEGC